MTNSKSKMILIHTADVFQIEISNMTAAQVCEAIAEEGYKMGSTSLRNLLSGKCKTTCGFELVEVAETEVAPVVIEEVKNVEVAPAVAIEEEIAPAVVEEVKETAQPVAEVQEEIKEVVASVLKTVRNNSKMHLAMIELSQANGATIQELMAKFGYSQGGAGATVFCKQAGILSKGYGLEKQKVEGRGTVLFLTVEGNRVTKEQLLIK